MACVRKDRRQKTARQLRCNIASWRGVGWWDTRELRQGPSPPPDDRSLGLPVHAAMRPVLISDWLRCLLLGKWSLTGACGCLLLQTAGRTAGAQAPYSSSCPPCDSMLGHYQASGLVSERNKNVNTPPPPHTHHQHFEIFHL